MARRHFVRPSLIALTLCAAALIASACGRSDPEDLLFDSPLDAGLGGGGLGAEGGFGATAGSAGTGASGGFAGTGASGGFAGTGASGGFAGTGATGGFAGTGASGGFAGTGATGGFAGTGASGGFAGTGASGGFAGTGASGGFAGTGASGGFAGTGGTPTDGGNFFDAFPFPDSGPIANCVQCAEQSCASQVNACFNNPSCAGGVVCAVTSCGGFNLGCVFGCFQGDFSAAIQAFQAFSCLASNCGQQCIGVIIGGGGGGTPPPVPGTPQPAPVAGGYTAVIPPELAQSLQIPAGPVYMPPLEVLDSLSAVKSSCAGPGRSCK